MMIKQGYDVVGLDVGYYDDCSFVPEAARVPGLKKDIRDVQVADLKGFEAVVHLAALSNDPLGNMKAQWTEDINFHASVRLAELAKAAGVRRFLFSSSCIMYGAAEAAVVNEESPLSPKTVYAESKVKSERSIRQLADDRFSPVFLRNGTVYGVSPRMRFDTVLNNLMGSAFTTGKVVVFSDGTPWRPVVHIEDASRAFMAVLEAPIEAIHNQAFNVGANSVNHQIRELAEVVAKTVPKCTVEYKAQPDADQRTYKTDFSKIARLLPQYQVRWDIRRGAQQLYQTFQQVRLTREDFVGQRFTRLRWIQHLLKEGRLDGDLRWKA
jgi:nucleoside-diphosphate-sugar epimerase